ncbi:paired amphipathic helix protein Sin3a [Kwoniella mangroviensis CBS 10435]|uniref:Paired amphipathic helix protein Sin3a n=1 Tax=Kwoniella mangroviensis CBS 10435 TaxID=1331196 RepID=A0A1B9ILW5_9TREE|nr:paired amphipathic helix protein Sin3a [Kwoniella mangroviensis CBS 10435]
MPPPGLSTFSPPITLHYNSGPSLTYILFSSFYLGAIQQPTRCLQPLPGCYERVQGSNVGLPNPIDTPGVIDRVSTLFRGHPSLIQGFNTFLPPGYRIECSGTDGDSNSLITVTTPAGTVSQIPGGFAAAIDQRERENRAKPSSVRPPPPPEQEPRPTAAAATASGGTLSTPSTQPLPPIHSHLATGPPPFQSASRPGTSSATTQPGRPSQPAASTQAPPGPLPLPPQTQQPLPPSGPSTPSAAQFLASGGLNNNQPSSGQAAQGGSRGPIMEFNHAITFVNKIKNRFNSEPDTYKQFLEILQTYQRDTRDIAEVYEQVTQLFNNAQDLLEEFKQFLPENGGFGGMAGFGSFVQAAAGAPPAAADKLGGQKRGGKESKEASAQKKRRAGVADVGKGAAQSKKKTGGQRGESPSIEDNEPASAPAPSGNQPQTLASPDEVAFFDKVKKAIDDKVVYHEFLKLINLFVQDMIDTQTLLERAYHFIGEAPEVWANFQKVVGANADGKAPPNPATAQGGYGFGGMIGVDNQVVENVPMLERVKPDLAGKNAKSFGPSYRKLPRTEINLQCTGRDAMCWEVLNDEWVSHPTWAAEDAAPFISHKKNSYEEMLHKSEEERHEYDYHIEANLRTIALLEPLNNKIQTMDPEERANFNLKAGLGGQSKSIYQRIIKKVYGKELGPDVIRALHENPVVALPIVLERLKAKDEEWKKAQREWNRVWREQDAKNFYKALDHQGVQFKTSDKKTLMPKSLLAEIESKRREQMNVRSALLDPRPWRAKPQIEFQVKDIEVLKDSIKLIISYLDRVSNSLSTQDQNRVERLLRDFIPALFMQDKDEFDAEFGDDDETPGEDSEESDGDVSMADDDETGSVVSTSKKGAKKTTHAADLRKKLLKQELAGREKRGSTMTPGPDGDNAVDNAPSVEGTPVTENGERAETPLPVPADPAEVAEAVEKDKAGAEASEQTWVQIDGLTESQVPSEKSSEAGAPEPKALPTRKANFFANNHFYVLIRLIQILYSRLVMCKDIAEKLASEKKQPINPLAIKLGLAEPDSHFFGIEDGENPAQHYYGHLLSMAERLFENEVDNAHFEETLRVMFGNKAYIMFTVDRVIAAIVKQAQTVVGDMKSQELFALLQRDRLHERTSTRRQIAYRMQAEGVLGSDENLFKISYQPSRDIVSIQLLGREDLSVDDAETAQEKWRQYIESYILTHPTEGLPHRVDPPLLQRNLDENLKLSSNEVITKDGIEIKIALGNYRMFFTPDTEDYFHLIRNSTEINETEQKEKTYLEGAKKRLDDWLENSLKGDNE